MTQQWQLQLDQLRSDSRVPLILAGIIGILLLFSLSQFVRNFKTEHYAIVATKTKTQTPLPIKLAQLHLFGVYSANLDNLPNAALQLTLQGTIVFLDNPALSRAIIASPTHPSATYKIGDTLIGNTTLLRIEKNYIVINVNGTLEKVPLPIQTLF